MPTASTKRQLVAVALAAVVAGGVGLAVKTIADAASDRVERYDAHSRYQRVLVEDDISTGRRYLRFSRKGGIQSRMVLDDPAALDLAYAKSMVAALAARPEAKKVLLVGLGGAAIPKFIQKHFPDVKLDVVERDREVVKVCQKFFEFKGTPNTRVFLQDGRMFLKHTDETYDLILLDAYADDYIPFHLTTIEFMRLVRKRLAPGGMVASNLWEKALNRFYLAELKTFEAVFAKLYRFDCTRSGNVIVFATLADDVLKRKTWIERARAVAGGRDLGFDLPALVRREYEYLSPSPVLARTEEKPITDDRAPVNTMRHEHPEHFEKEARER